MLRGLRCKPRQPLSELFGDGSEVRMYILRTEMVLSVATTAKWQPRHQQDRVTVHQRKLRSIFNIGQFLTGLSIFQIRTTPRVCSSCRHLSAFQRTSFVLGDCLWLWSCRAHFSFNAGLSCLFQRRCLTTLKVRPCSGTLDHARLSLNRGKHALPLTRHCQVDWGLCPMIVPLERTRQFRLASRSETLTRK